MNTSIFLVNVILQPYIIAFLLRVWIQLVKYNAYNQFVKFIFNITQPIIEHVQKVIQTTGNIDMSSLFASFMMCVLKVVILAFFLKIRFHYFINYILIGLLIMTKYIGIMILWAIIIRLLSNILVRNFNSMYYLLIQLTDPLINKIQSILPRNSHETDLSGVCIVIIIFLLNCIGMDLFPAIWTEL